MTHSTAPACSLAGLLVLALACGHDSTRDNPLDPALTPAVELQVVLDDTIGNARLTWTAYEGAAVFSRYHVLRNIAGRTQLDTLVSVADRSRTSYVDSTMAANTAYEYRIAVVNTAGFETVSPTASTQGFAAAAVDLDEPELDRERGRVILRWSRFDGPRFGAYRIERFSADLLDFAEVARVEGAADTTFTDSALVTDVSYSYRVVVEAAGSAWVSNRTGAVRLSAAPVFILSVALDGRDGEARVAWSRYAGDQPFESYQISRRIAGESRTVVRETITDEAQTSFVDTEVEVGRIYIYLVTVISSSGAALESDPREVFFPVMPATLEAQFDRANLSANLSWTRAPVGFEHYEIRRQALAGGPEVILETITDIEDTTYVDTGLEVNTEYRYTVTTQSVVGAEADSAPAIGPIWPKLAFYAARDGVWDVWVMHADGSNQVNLTTHPAHDGHAADGCGGRVGRPAWSPDGSQIAFVSYRDGLQNAEIYLMDADGSNPVNISNDPGCDTQPSWSPDGERIVFSSYRDDRRSELYTMDRDGTNQTRLTDNPDFDLGPMWSPDGTRIAFWSVRDGNNSGNIYTMGTDGSGITQVTDTGDWGFDPDWSPDGSRIAYLGGSGNGVFVVDADGSGTPVQINTGGAWPDWSPDGSKIAYTCERDGSGEWQHICVSNADGSAEVNLTEGYAGTHQWCDWLPTAE